MPRKMAGEPGAATVTINANAVTPATEHAPMPAPAREEARKLIALLRS
jgi:hypothetical protein